MENIAEFLESSVKVVRTDRKNPEYKIRTVNQKGHFVLCSYLNQYPLFSSKYSNFKDWSRAFQVFKNSKRKTAEKIKQIIDIKSGMNTEKSFWNCDHLKNFYTRDKI